MGTMTFSGAALFVSFVVRFINNRVSITIMTQYPIQENMVHFA